MKASAIIAISILCSCARGGFPPGFLFGTAIAGFQVDMGCPTVPAAQCEDRNSDWYAWITRPELLSDPSTYLAGTPPAQGPGFFELYPQDLARAAGELGSNALRLSIEWSRVFPVSTIGVPDLHSVASPAALAYYHAIFAAMKAKGLTPLVTLNHYTLPSWLHDAYGCHQDLQRCSPRGWLEPAAIDEAARYAGFVAGEFPEVGLWATLNEPFTAVVLAGYLLPSADRTNPPGVSLQWTEAKAVYGALVHAHARMYDAAKAAAPHAQVGIVYNLEAVTAKNAARDAQAARDFDYVTNRAFLDAIVHGDFDDLTGHIVHDDSLAGLDFIGVNYYYRATVESAGGQLFADQTPYVTFDPFTLALTSDASGLGEVLGIARSFGKPIYITETGVGDPDDTGAGAQWIADTFAQTRGAIARGADVRGYFYWTLMDNYEWNHGMTLKYGLYAVDPNDPSKARVPRAKAVAAFLKR
ncbi:MAG TPA: family 1 glycosylhydrolase [Myxococcales bacterium]|nr:family 1 glycosylhydrolase [Myxococcales bacterium]